MKCMQSIGNKKYCLILTILILLETPLFDGNPVYGQRSRRTSPVTTRKPGPIFKTKETAPTQTANQLEERNKELVKQILDLQYERDFYKKKITEWTATQRVNPEPEPEQKVESEAKPPQQPVYIPFPMGGYQAPLSGAALARPGISRADSLLNAARISQNRGYFDEALSQFSAMMNSSGCGDRHYLEFGKLLYKLGNFPRAVEILSYVSGDDSLVVLSAYYKGRIFQEQNLFKVAEIEFMRSRVLGHGFNGYLVARGYQFLIGNQPDSAAIIFRQALPITPELQAEIFAGLAEVSFLNGDRTQEINQLQQSLVHDPGYFITNFNLGVALLDAGEYQSALTFFKRVEKYSQADYNVNFYLGQTYYYLRQWDMALRSFLDIDPQKWPAEEIRADIWIPKIYYIKSLLAKAGGNYYEATNYFRKAREINPDANSWMQSALTDLAGIYESGKNYNSALDYYSQKLRLNPNDSQTLLKLGTVYYQAGDLSTARQVFLDASKNPATVDQAEIWLNTIDSNSNN